jgi:hypothetical protein
MGRMDSPRARVRQGSERKERFLHRMLLKLDKESRKEELRKEKKVAKARKKLKVGKFKGVVPVWNDF